MIRGLILLCFVCLVPTGIVGFSQAKLDALNLSIATDKSTFVRRERIQVRITITNKTGQTIETDSIPVSFYLSKYGKDVAKCHFPDCFIAPTYWAKKFNDGETRNLEVDLTDLYWNELISSQIDLHRPKNLFEKVAPGEYSLFMEFLFTDPKSGRRHSRMISVTSNAVIVKIG